MEVTTKSVSKEKKPTKADIARQQKLAKKNAKLAALEEKRLAKEEKRAAKDTVL